MKNHNNVWKKSLNLSAIVCVLSLAMWLSSYGQLLLFKSGLDSQAWRQLAYLWVIGIWIDLFSLSSVIFAKPSFQPSTTPGISIFFYVFPNLIYGKPTFLSSNIFFPHHQINENIELSLLKVFEFLLLLLLHFIVIYIIRKISSYRI